VTIVPSEFTRGAVIEGWGIAPERVSAVHHGVDIERFKPQPGGAEILASQLGASRPYVLFVGIPSRAKGTLTLKKAFRHLINEGFPHALVIVGPRSDLEIPGFNDEVDAPMIESDRFLRIESLRDDHLAPLMAGADVFCLPSIKESFGLPSLEAMASGVPVVVANRAALPEVVGDAGVLCEPTEEDVAASLARVLADADLARDLGEAGRRRAKTMTWDDTASGWLIALERAAREH
jgi:glycosyltransferase involved in cell wall biosynthesis